MWRHASHMKIGMFEPDSCDAISYMIAVVENSRGCNTRFVTFWRTRDKGASLHKHGLELSPFLESKWACLFIPWFGLPTNWALAFVLTATWTLEDKNLFYSFGRLLHSSWALPFWKEMGLVLSIGSTFLEWAFISVWP